MRGFLSDCHKVEIIAGQIYQQLAGDPAYAREVRAVFQRLGSDERDHARQIDLALQATAQELDAISRISAEKIDAAVALVERIHATVNQRRLREEEALRLAVEMEQQFINVHIHNCLHFDNEKVSALFTELGSQDQAHIEQLRDCLRWWQETRKNTLSP